MMKAMCKRLVNNQERMPMVFMSRNRFGSYNVQLYIRKDSTLIKHFIEGGTSFLNSRMLITIDLLKRNMGEV